MSPKNEIYTTEKYLTPTQVGEILKVAPVTVRAWALDGRLQFMTTPGGHRRFKKTDIEQFARDHGVNLPSENKEMRILIVDDDRDFSEFLTVALLKQNIIVSVANDGFDAGEQIHTFKPTVVLLDLIMPGLDGFETCQRLKANPLTQHLRVIALTGFHDEKNIARILKAGAECCLAKPIRETALLEAIGVEPNYQQTVL